MRPVRYVAKLCGKGLRTYWSWMVQAGEQMGDYYGPW
ncbi:hypothetical protein J2S03_002719 [Alicyclobacillus cycloheptanicus]|uniref:Uncharacterized protein n=1 Tax=Alicyclobacillus cycloheptanicus TaxID=1457 RepID=A0ABT9XKM0_9BACL|nr:hypothetical protein [Alicyclobacillus cycloheptanicus]